MKKVNANAIRPREGKKGRGEGKGGKTEEGPPCYIFTSTQNTPDLVDYHTPHKGG